MSKLSLICFYKISPIVVLDQGHQGLLELFWTVYSEEELQSCLQLRNLENPFHLQDKSVVLFIRNTMHKK